MGLPRHLLSWSLTSWFSPPLHKGLLLLLLPSCFLLHSAGKHSVLHERRADDNRGWTWVCAQEPRHPDRKDSEPPFSFFGLLRHFVTTWIGVTRTPHLSFPCLAHLTPRPPVLLPLYLYLAGYEYHHRKFRVWVFIFCVWLTFLLFSHSSCAEWEGGDPTKSVVIFFSPQIFSNVSSEVMHPVRFQIYAFGQCFHWIHLKYIRR